MNFLENILNFITDSNKRLSVKTAIVILTLLSVIVIDNVTGFSYFYNSQRKLDQLESIRNLLKDTTLTTETRHKLIVMQNKTFERQNIFDYSFSFLKNISSTSSNNSQTRIKSNGNIIRNDFWFLLSTSGIHILITVIVFPIVLLTNKTSPFWNTLATLIILLIIMISTISFNYWLFDKIIPDKIFGSWTWNYILNAILQIGIIVGIYYLTRDSIEKKAQTHNMRLWLFARLLGYRGFVFRLSFCAFIKVIYSQMGKIPIALFVMANSKK